MFCTKCGKENPEGTKFCGSCGAELGSSNPTPQQVGQDTNQPQPTPQTSNPALNNEASTNQIPNNQQPNNQTKDTEPKPKSDGKYAVMSVGEYFGSMLLMAIPIVGWIFAIVWSLGGTKKVNKANLARATLINIVICIGIWVAIGSAVKLAFNAIGEAVSGIMPGNGTSEGFDIGSFLGGDTSSLEGLLDSGSLDSLMQQFGGGGYTL